MSDAHEVIRKITLEAEQSNAQFFDVLKKHADSYERIQAQLKKLGKDADLFFAKPENYHGLAAEKSKRLADKYKALLKNDGEKLTLRNKNFRYRWS